MFDYIKCEYALPELPEPIVKQWGSKADITFQTKDTPNQYMCLYKIDVEGQLWRKDMTTEWVEPKDPNSESIFDRLGHRETLSTWWEKEEFSGIITFYDSYHHEEYSTYEKLGNKEWQRFECGWIEYLATFLKGKLIGDIDISKNKVPIKLTDEELSKKRSEWEESRIAYNASAKKHRKKNPTPEQRLIDDIYNYVSVFASNVQGGKNYLVEEIMGKINCFRQTHDKFYEKLN
jgi:hypothetical protein